MSRSHTRAARSVVVFAALLVSACAAVAADPPGPGDPAPSLEGLEVLQGPGSLELLDDAKGKALVLEFWATWCHPCIAALPHWNQLNEELVHEPIVFLSVTSEEAEVVRRFLERRRFHGWIGVDTGGVLHDAYGVVGLPYTVLVDAEGRIRAITVPRDITADALRRLAAGQDPALRSRFDASEKLASAMDLILDAFGVLVTRVVLEAELPEGTLNVAVRADTPEDLDRRMRELVEAALGIEAVREERDVDVYRLVRIDGPAPGFRPAVSEESSRLEGDGGFRGIAMTGEDLASLIERQVGRPVLDETGLEGRYDVSLIWDPDAEGGLERALREELGLELRADRATVELLVVRKQSPAIPD